MVLRKKFRTKSRFEKNSVFSLFSSSVSSFKLGISGVKLKRSITSHLSKVVHGLPRLLHFIQHLQGPTAQLLVHCL